MACDPDQLQKLKYVEHWDPPRLMQKNFSLVTLRGNSVHCRPNIVSDKNRMRLSSQAMTVSLAYSVGCPADPKRHPSSTGYLPPPVLTTPAHLRPKRLFCFPHWPHPRVRPHPAGRSVPCTSRPGKPLCCAGPVP